MQPILQEVCVVQYFSHEDVSASTLATLACCSKDCHIMYGGLLERKKRFYISPRWIAYVLWQPDIQPYPGVSMASMRRLRNAMSLTREQLTDVYLSQDNFLMYLEDDGKPVLADEDMRLCFKLFDEAILLVDSSERDRQKLCGQVRKALHKIPLFLLRLLVARDCHQGRVLSPEYDKFRIEYEDFASK